MSNQLVCPFTAALAPLVVWSGPSAQCFPQCAQSPQTLAVSPVGRLELVLDHPLNDAAHPEDADFNATMQCLATGCRGQGLDLQAQ